MHILKNQPKYIPLNPFKTSIIFFLIITMNYGKFWFLLSFIIFATILLKKKIEINWQFLIIFIYFSIYIVFSIYNYSEIIRIEVYFYMILYLVNTILGCTILSKIDSHTFNKGIKLTIATLGLLIIIQHIYYLIFNNYIDIHKLITFGEFESRYTNYFTSKWGLIRPTGIAIEPSNMGNIISILTTIYVIKIEKPDKFSISMMLLSILTLSFASIITSILIVLIFTYETIKNKSNISIFISSLIIIFICCIFGYIFYLRITGIDTGYDAIGTRSKILEIIFKRDLLNNLFGSGILLFNDEITYLGFKIKIYNIQDTGFILNSIFSFGIIGTLLFVTLIFSKLKLTPIFIVILILMFTKIDYMQPLFWMLLYFIFNNRFYLHIDK